MTDSITYMKALLLEAFRISTVQDAKTSLVCDRIRNILGAKPAGHPKPRQ